LRVEGQQRIVSILRQEGIGMAHSAKLSIGNRESAIPTNLGQAMVAEILRKKRRDFQLVPQGGIGHPGLQMKPTVASMRVTAPNCLTWYKAKK